MSDDLVERLRDWRQQWIDFHGEMGSAFPAVELLGSAIVEIERLRADKERLDFIGNSCGGEGVLIWQYPGIECPAHVEVICSGRDGEDLRAAIDAERKR